MASGRPQRPNDPSVMSSIEAAVREIRRPGPLELFWNWRWELGILAAAAGLSVLIADSLGLIGLAIAAGAGLAVIGALLRWPPARERIVARAWCVITPHRVRAGCVHAWVQTRRGKLPLVVSTVPTDYGERVQLWCRAGITAGDLLAARNVLAAACWAAEVRVVPSLRYAHLVTLEVIRNQSSERPGPTLDAWPFLRPVEGDGTDDSEERDTISRLCLIPLVLVHPMLRADGKTCILEGRGCGWPFKSPSGGLHCAIQAEALAPAI
jgi:hypothetical protein